jgi:hypothetical protein
MEIVKKNLVSIICGVIAVLAAVAVFVWPLNGYYETLKSDAEKRAAVAEKIKSLEKKNRELPIVHLEQKTAQPLGRFPSKDVIKEGQDAREKIEKRSAGVYNKAVAINEEPHQPVAANVLPEPRDQTTALKFAQRYADALKALRTEVLQAGVPPTQEAFQERADGIWKTLEKELIYVPGNPEPVNKDQILQKFKVAEAELPQLMQNEMATKYKMYVDPNAVFKLPAALPMNRAPDPSDIWWCHIEYWVYRDVCNAIAEVNKNSNSILVSPVKNLLVLNVPWGFFPNQSSVSSGGGGGGGAVRNDAGQYVGGGGGGGDESAAAGTAGPPDPTVTVPDGPVNSPTRRISNNLYDVVHFDLVVDVEATAVPIFLKTLATNRFITVLEMDMDAVDSQMLKFEGYVYGDRPVVQLKLRCEALFLRQWSMKYMPPAIKRMLGVADQQQLQRAGL